MFTIFFHHYKQVNKTFEQKEVIIHQLSGLPSQYKGAGRFDYGLEL